MIKQKRRKPGKRKDWGKDEKEGGTYQSAGHRGLVILRKMLFQGQDNAVGNDGGQNHVLKWRRKEEVKEHIHRSERDEASMRAVHTNTQTLSKPYDVRAVCMISEQAGSGQWMVLSMGNYNHF